MRQSLGLRTSQQLSLTPQLQQSIKLLQLSTLDLNQEVQQMLELNPFLESESNNEPDTSFEEIQRDWQANEQANAELSDSFYDNEDTSHLPISNTVIDWQQTQIEPHWDQSDHELHHESTHDAQIDVTVASDPSQDTFAETNSHNNFNSNNGPQDGSWLETLEAPARLSEYLAQQIRLLQLPEQQEIAMFFLIHSISENGYLEESIEEIANHFIQQESKIDLNASIELFENVLPIFQSLEPAGLGARNLSECLTLQLQQLLRENKQVLGQTQYLTGLALRICQHPLDLLAKRDYKSLAQLCSTTEQAIKEAAEVIRSLNPHPTKSFNEQAAQAVVPDVLVRQHGNIFEVFLNDQVVPKLLINQSYADCLQYDKNAANLTLQKTLQEAKWFIKSIHQRFDTILRVSRCIVDRQHLFFEKGAFALKPLVLKEVADELGLHESTISRVTNQKYMATPHGTFELKYFFTSGLATQSGSATSSTVVREWIKTWIGQEAPEKPLSDQKIADLLEAKGIECARRTVAKYRESLKIAPASMRRQN